MSESKRDTGSAWTDPDDAPELTDDWFESADLNHGGVLVRRGRPPIAHPKERITLRVDHDVAEALRASGKGWQTRVNAALREWLGREAG